jgi:hypothetical protein
MSYFNHAFKKTFVGTNASAFTDLSEGKLGTDGNVPARGQFGFVDKNWDIVPTNKVWTSANACPLTLFAGSIHTIDKIGPFAGGYTETVKSKVINPKYVSAFYKVEAHPSQAAQFIVGQVHGGETEDPLYNQCAKKFYCGGSYNFRIDIKGSPALRFLTHNMYLTVSANGGCCAEPTSPVEINPLVVYAQWAYNILNNPIFSKFVKIQVTYSTDSGLNWEQLAPNTSGDSSKLTGELSLLNYINGVDAYPDGSAEDFSDMRAGLIINGAYEDTRFGDCTFYPNDSIISFMEPIKIYGSEVDLNGDPCAFSGLCMYQHCVPIQVAGTGENAIRDLIMTEAYMQQPMYTGMDLRIREITNGTDVFDAIDRTSLYDRYYIQHNVPRFNNPSSTFDNDQYLLEIIVNDTYNMTTFINFVEDWLTAAGSPCVGLTTYGDPGTCARLVPTYED